MISRALLVARANKRGDRVTDTADRHGWTDTAGTPGDPGSEAGLANPHHLTNPSKEPLVEFQ